MEKYADIATGFTKRNKEEVNTFWKGLEKEVNSFGPPVKSLFEWKKARLLLLLLFACAYYCYLFMCAYLHCLLF